MVPNAPLSTRRSFSASPSGREVDLRLGLDRSWSGVGVLQLQLIGVRDEANVAGAPIDLGVTANWRARF